MELKDWFIINTKPRQEEIAKSNLESQGVEVYLPMYIRKVKKKKVKIENIIPLFPGYIFARFDVDKLFHKVKYTRGVKKILCNKNSIFTISDEVINQIKQREENGVVKLIPKDYKFKKGDKVLIDEGVFDGWEGIFYKETEDAQRAVILLTNIKYTSKLIIPKEYLTIDK